MKLQKELNGNWEEPGVIGTRIEISGKNIVILWRNSPVLETKFTVVELKDKILLHLKKSGLRYSGTVTDYATVMSLTYKDGLLELKEFFPLTGESRTVLKKTENSRYGNYTEVDRQAIPIIKGKWISEDGHFKIEFKDDFLIVGDLSVKIHILQSNSEYSDKGALKIVDADPSHYDILNFNEMVYKKGMITATIPVCDAPAYITVFKRMN